MEKGRLEAFSDGVIAIIITIMVLEMKVPHDTTFRALFSLAPLFFSYVVSYVYVGIYWNNHHHLLKTAHRINGAIMWANLHLLFWLSLVPLVTGWMGENHFAPLPTAAYGFVLWMAANAFILLQTALRKEHGPGSVIAQALGRDRKGKVSWILYVISIPLAFVQPWISGVIFVLVAVLWFLPDRRIERSLLVSGAHPPTQP